MTYSADPIIDFNVSSIDTINLTPNQIEQAVNRANSLIDSDQQWQAYLNTLALLGFTSWLNQRVPELVVNANNHQFILNGICQLRIGEFNLCLLTQGTLKDEFITLPRIAINERVLDTENLGEQTTNQLSHDFYVLVTVDEEQEQISLEGLIRQDQLINYQQLGQLILQADQTYEIPLAWFDGDINHLLLYVCCLEPSAIQALIPTVETETDNPLTSLMQPVINVGKWLQGELDELAERLSWLLLPTPELALATASFRSLPTLEILLEELRNQEVIIPNTARGASQNFNFGGFALQLYALTWLLEQTNEWSLLLILGTANDQPLPEGLKLMIEDENQILSEQEVYINQDQTYLYSQVIGEPNESFRLTLTLNNGEQMIFPSFTILSESL